MKQAFSRLAALAAAGWSAVAAFCGCGGKSGPPSAPPAREIRWHSGDGKYQGKTVIGPDGKVQQVTKP